MTAPSDAATERDVALDVVAALDMYDGLCGSEETSIESVGPGENDTVVVLLDNGQQFRLQVREIRT